MKAALTLLRCLAVVGTLALLTVAAGGSGGEPETPDSEICGVCHDFSTTHFQTIMCQLAGEGFPSCATCHANAAQHAEEGDPSLVGIIPREEHDTFCRTCHSGPEHTVSGAIAHISAGVYCIDCHDIHPEQLLAPKMLRKEVGELCASCHPAQQASFRKPYAHRLEHSGMTCISCHNPHGGPGERSLRRDSTGEGPCLGCHADKRGPFVFPHVSGVTGDCLSCHQAHGSSNMKRLTRSRVDQLCLECHSPVIAGPLGSQPPSFHDLRSARYRECTVCHVTIHGSNSSPELLR